MTAPPSLESPPSQLVPQRGGRPINVVLFGPPASGKGTQAELLVARYGMVHISTGDLLRARKKFLPELANFMDHGQLVPDDIVTAVLKERLGDADCNARGVLLDGFPRTVAQAESLQSAGVQVSDVIHLDVTDEVVLERIAGRRIDPLSGKIYHVVDNPPPAEIAHRAIQREDDTPEKICKRLDSYHNAKDAIMAFYGRRVKSIHVGDDTPSALPANVRPLLVFDRVRKALEGDTYYGSVIRSELTTKAYECGNHATSLQTISRYFEHSRYRMLWHGCLADLSVLASRVALRALVLHVAECLKPLQTYQVRAWLERVSDHTVILGHAISHRLQGGFVEDVARGSSAVVFLGAKGEAMRIPNVRELQDLVAPATALRGHTPVNSLVVDRPDDMSKRIGLRPDRCWRCRWAVSADELDLSGFVHEGSCISYFERMRFNAAAENGYSELNDLVLRARTTRCYVSYVGFATQGDVLEGFSWIYFPEDVVDPQGTLHVAFEIYRGDALLLTGCLTLTPDLAKGNLFPSRL